MVVRSRAALLRLLDEHVGFLERSNTMFDQGHESEAKRMAVSLRVLFRQTPRNSHSLINQLGLESTLMWVDSAGIPDPTNLIGTPGLVNVRTIVGGDTSFVAPLGNRPPTEIQTAIGPVPRFTPVPFSGWWEDPVAKDFEGESFSRMDFVLALSDNEGGAHVDPKVKSSYDKLANSNSMGFSYTQGEGPEIPLSNPVLPSVRQISYEVLESISSQRHLIT